MPRRLPVVLSLLTCLVLGTGCAGRLATDPSRPWHLRGAVVSADGERVTVRHKSGQLVVLALDGRTAYVRDARPASVSELVPGARVRVDVVPDAAQGRVSRVTIF